MFVDRWSRDAIPFLNELANGSFVKRGQQYSECPNIKGFICKLCNRPTLTANANNTEDDEIVRRMRFAAQHYHKQIAFKNE